MISGKKLAAPLLPDPGILGFNGQIPQYLLIGVAIFVPGFPLQRCHQQNQNQGRSRGQGSGGGQEMLQSESLVTQNSF